MYFIHLLNLKCPYHLLLGAKMSFINIFCSLIPLKQISKTNLKKKLLTLWLTFFFLKFVFGGLFKGIKKLMKGIFAPKSSMI